VSLFGHQGLFISQLEFIFGRYSLDAYQRIHSQAGDKKIKDKNIFPSGILAALFSQRPLYFDGSLLSAAPIHHAALV
jgi:hypothetical protein